MNSFINFCDLFRYAEKANELPKSERNHIIDSIKQFIRKKNHSSDNIIFDDKEKI